MSVKLNWKTHSILPWLVVALIPPEPRGVFCPADDGSKIFALVSYPDGHQIQISVGMTGCELVTNGDVSRTAAGYGRHPRRGPRLLAQLERLVGGGAAAETNP